ncbi:hypothetical protein ACJMK2_007701, partial [Sinanodonta woodiana]
NGNIRLGDRSYKMRPSEAYAIPSYFLELMDLRGKRYVLQDQAPVLSGMSEQNNEETSGVENNVEDKYTDLPRRMPYPYEQDKQNLFIKRDGMFEAGNVQHIQNIFSTGRSITGGICDAGRRVSIVHVTDFDKTTRTAAHALGHALRALHDGEYAYSTCRPEHKFIMSPSPPVFKTGFRYGLNPWTFSDCSVGSFRETLVK